jgi:hypothetical protein
LKTNLRLLLDECLQAELAEEIKTWKKVKAEWVCDLVSFRGRSVSDEELMQHAQSRKSILVTVERRLNEKRFEICTHHGILVFKAMKRHECVKAEIFKKFMLCGQRKLCKHAVTYLMAREIIFRRKDADGREFDTHIEI